MRASCSGNSCRDKMTRSFDRNAIALHVLCEVGPFGSLSAEMTVLYLTSERSVRLMVMLIVGTNRLLEIVRERHHLLCCVLHLMSMMLRCISSRSMKMMMMMMRRRMTTGMKTGLSFISYHLLMYSSSC